MYRMHLAVQIILVPAGVLHLQYGVQILTGSHMPQTLAAAALSDGIRHLVLIAVAAVYRVHRCADQQKGFHSSDPVFLAKVYDLTDHAG
jgi:hypothetical protein